MATLKLKQKEGNSLQDISHTCSDMMYVLDDKEHVAALSLMKNPEVPRLLSSSKRFFNGFGMRTFFCHFLVA